MDVPLAVNVGAAPMETATSWHINKLFHLLWVLFQFDALDVYPYIPQERKDEQNEDKEIAATRPISSFSISIYI